MRLILFLTTGLILLAAGCAKAPQQKAITIVNAAAVDAPVLERLRVFAESELHVPVRTLEKPRLAGQKSFQALEKAGRNMKNDADVTLIILAGIKEEPGHLVVNPEQGIAVVNPVPLDTGDAEKFARRMERMVMRAAAFSFGMPPTPDPFCVTRDYTSLEDLDKIGRNFSPPWQGRFAEEASNRGLRALDAAPAERIP
jgi:hypothetical protein